MRVTSQPTLGFDPDALPAGSGTVGVHGLDPEWLAFFAASAQTNDLLKSMFRVVVVPAEATEDDGLPDVSGRYDVLAGVLRFIPHFPFARGVRYRASFNPPLIGDLRPLEASTLEFSLPMERVTAPAKIASIFPSSGRLPENLLRFYVRFSTPMQRGHVQEYVTLLDADGHPAPDVLYRAPVELWDRSKRHLTVLLDPGRLKRGVGPNVALGPPLKAGREYTLAISAGMPDASGQPVRESFHKCFRIEPAVREPIAVEQWKLVRPLVGSREALTLTFPRPLDWAMLWRSITIESADNQVMDGKTTIDEDERHWSFAPESSWIAGIYHVRVAADLEDVCGNSVVAVFDGPLRPDSALPRKTANRSIAFQLE